MNQQGNPGSDSPEQVIGVFLLDDHEIIRRGVRDLLEAQPDIRIVGEAESAARALPLIRATRPDVAVLDVRLDDGDGITVCRDIRSELPEVACLMLTSYDDDEAMRDAVVAGAAGYVLKHIEGTDLVGAVRTAASGKSLLDDSKREHVIARLRGEPERPSPLDVLSPREREVFDLIAEGLTNRQIGERIFLAEKSVKNIVSSVFVKLGLERRTQAAAYAVRLSRPWPPRER